MSNCKWTGILKEKMDVDTTPQEYKARINALFEYFGITDEFSTNEIVKYRCLVGILAGRLKIPGFCYKKYKFPLINEIKDFIFWLEFNKIKIMKQSKKQTDTVYLFKKNSTNKILKSFQRKADDTILDDYKRINKDNKLVNDFKKEKDFFYDCNIEEIKKLNLENKITQKYKRELRKKAELKYLELINSCLLMWSETYFIIKKVFEKE